jgi:hypothetical protein
MSETRLATRRLRKVELRRGRQGLGGADDAEGAGWAIVL